MCVENLFAFVVLPLQAFLAYCYCAGACQHICLCLCPCRPSSPILAVQVFASTSICASVLAGLPAAYSCCRVKAFAGQQDVSPLLPSIPCSRAFIPILQQSSRLPRSSSLEAWPLSSKGRFVLASGMGRASWCRIPCLRSTETSSSCGCGPPTRCSSCCYMESILRRTGQYPQAVL